MSDLNKIYDFLAQRRIAVVGVSGNPKHFSRYLFRELIERKYQICPINPKLEHIDNFPCYKNITDVMQTDFGDTPVGGVIVMTARDKFTGIVGECIKAGVKRIWLYGTLGSQKANQESIDLCRAGNVDLISDYCPFMFLPQTGFIHRFHAGFLKLIGKYPKE
jgi:predicted CoA-binding protein